MSFIFGRPSIDVLGGSLPGPSAGQGLGLEDELVKQEDEGETVSPVKTRGGGGALI